MTRAGQQVTAATILGADQFVTGVRGLAGDDVVLTGTSIVNGVQNAMLYVGPISPTESGGVHTLTPVFAGQHVTGATFYGPDTPLFNPAIRPGNVRAVGSYTYAQTDTRNHGMLYEGPPAGGGTWTRIDVPSSLVGGRTVENTIAHSTMGDLVVGNYDLQGVPASANAFIYDIVKKTWTLFDIGGTANLTTAYGIWQITPGDHNYIIVGGSRDGTGLNKGLVVDYNAFTGTFAGARFYSAMNLPTLVTHFEGITATATGFNLAAGSSNGMALLASIRRLTPNGFSEARWIPFVYPDSVVTTGNTVYQNVMLGIYAQSGGAGVQSYAATFG